MGTTLVSRIETIASSSLLGKKITLGDLQFEEAEGPSRLEDRRPGRRRELWDSVQYRNSVSRPRRPSLGKKEVSWVLLLMSLVKLLLLPLDLLDQTTSATATETQTYQERCRRRIGKGLRVHAEHTSSTPDNVSKGAWWHHTSSVQAPQVNRTSTWPSSTQASFQTLPSALRYAIFPIPALPPHHPIHKTFTTSYTSSSANSSRCITS